MIELIPAHGPLYGTVALPYSKSLLNRALILAYLANSPLQISDADDRIARDSRLLCRALDGLKNEASTIDVQDAGTAMRFMTAVCTITPGEWRIVGTKRMHRRPMKALIDALRTLGADIRCEEEEGHAPLLITGKKLTGGNTRIKGNISSQFISALLLIAPTLEHGLELTIDGELLSAPYVAMTLAMMKQQNVIFKRDGQKIKIEGGALHTQKGMVETDWSAAAFFYGMLAVADEGELKLQGLQEHSLQGDSKCAQVYERLGVLTEYTSEGVTIRKGPIDIDAFEADCRDFPDMAQSLAFCCAAKGLSCRLSGLDTLPGKETDRIAAIRTELKKIGIDCATDDFSLSFKATSLKENKGIFRTYDDHRMAMAMSILGIKNAVRLDDGKVVSKSFPAFFEQLKKLGIAVRT